MTQQPEVISFAGGLPAPELFPVEEIAAAAERVFSTRGQAALQYSVTEGVPELRTWIAERMNARYGTSFAWEDVLVTTGSQQALDIYAKVLLDPGDVVLLENPSYLGAIQAFDAYQPTYVSVETDEDGLIPEALDEVLRKKSARRPKFLYTIPTFQNPTGRTLSSERRAKVVEICRRHELPVFEDNPYGELSFESTPPPPLIASEPRGLISYSGTASKIVAPGLRIGWIIVPDRALRDKLVPAKRGIRSSLGLARAVHLARVRERRRALGAAHRVDSPDVRTAAGRDARDAADDDARARAFQSSQRRDVPVGDRRSAHRYPRALPRGRREERRVRSRASVLSGARARRRDAVELLELERGEDPRRHRAPGGGDSRVPDRKIGLIRLPSDERRDHVKDNVRSSTACEKQDSGQRGTLTSAHGPPSKPIAPPTPIPTATSST